MEKQRLNVSGRPTRQNSHNTTSKISKWRRLSASQSNVLMTKGSSLSSVKSRLEDDFERSEDKHPIEIRLSENTNAHSKHEMGKLEIKFDGHADQKFTCRCNICEEDSHKKRDHEEGCHEIIFFKGFTFDENQQSPPIEKDFVFILKRLAPLKYMMNTLRLFIPDTACFIQGECKLIVYTGKV